MYKLGHRPPIVWCLSVGFDETLLTETSDRAHWPSLWWQAKEYEPTLFAGLLARSHYPDGPATGHLGTGLSRFPRV